MIFCSSLLSQDVIHLFTLFSFFLLGLCIIFFAIDDSDERVESFISKGVIILMETLSTMGFQGLYAFLVLFFSVTFLREVLILSFFIVDGLLFIIVASSF